MIINATRMNDEAILFTLMKHRINNTGWMMKWWWNSGVGGTKGKPRYWEDAKCFYLHFSTPEEKAMSRICASNTKRNLQTFGWCLQLKQSCPWAAKQSRENQCNGVSRFKKSVSEKLSVINPLKNEEKSLANWIRYICRQKTTTSLWNLDRKGDWIKRKSVTTSSWCKV